MSTQVENKEQDSQKKLEEERYKLANSINESTGFIYSLLKRLSKTQEEDRAMVIVGMMVEEYLKTGGMVKEYKDMGGVNYGIDRGLWREVMGY